MGAIDYVVKPFDTDIVSAKIRNYLTMLNQGERLPGAIRGGSRRLVLPVAAAVLVAGLAVYAGVQLLPENGAQEYSEQAASGEVAKPSPAPAARATPPQTQQPPQTAPSSPTAMAPITP